MRKESVLPCRTWSCKPARPSRLVWLGRANWPRRRSLDCQAAALHVACRSRSRTSTRTHVLHAIPLPRASRFPVEAAQLPSRLNTHSGGGAATTIRIAAHPLLHARPAASDLITLLHTQSLHRLPLLNLLPNMASVGGAAILHVLGKSRIADYCPYVCPPVSSLDWIFLVIVLAIAGGIVYAVRGSAVNESLKKQKEAMKVRARRPIHGGPSTASLLILPYATI